MIARVFKAVIAASALAAMAAGPVFAQSRPVEVNANHTTIVRLPGDAEALIIGNEAIADATLYDARTVFVTGKGLGRTNMMALDEQGRVLYASDLVVGSGERGAVQVYRAGEGARYVCAPVCEIVPEAGANGG